MFFCDDCVYQAKMKCGLLKHQKTIHKSVPNEEFYCEDCSKLCFDLRDLQNHIVTQHPMSLGSRRETLFCDNCGFKAYQKQSVLHHQLKNHYNGPKPRFSCDKCLATFVNRHIQMLHPESISPNPEKFICALCFSENMEKSNLLQHLKRGHPSQRESFMCDRCRKEFRGRQGLQKHKCLHLSEKNFRCDICGYQSLERNNLALHYNFVHLKKKRVATLGCDSCEKWFSRRHCFIDHMAVFHSENFPTLTCKDCDYTTKSRKNYIAHRKSTHGGLPRSYICDHCRQAWRYKMGLETHLLHCDLR